jgi:AmmeMemoRadiSam system protein B
MCAAKLSENVRPPAVAGMFNPRDPGEPRAEVLRFLAAVAAPSAAAPKVLIAPHAGYVYWGQTAAAAFGSLHDGGRIERVVVIGPAHYHDYGRARRLDGETAALIERGAWPEIGRSGRAGGWRWRGC